MKIPFIGLDRHFRRHENLFLKLAKETWSTGRVIDGATVGKFETYLSELSGRRYCVSLGSCTDALKIALQCAGVKHGDEVIVTAYSFAATVSAIVAMGARPVFVDIDPSSFLMLTEEIECKITPRTKAIMIVHLFGSNVSMHKIVELSAKYSLGIIEDAAQSFCSDLRSLTSQAPNSTYCISFSPTKNLPAFSNAGALLTNDKSSADLALALRQYGKNREKEFCVPGMNSRLPTHEAAFLLSRVKNLKEWENRRTEIARYYRKGLADIFDLQLPIDNSASSWHKFVLKTNQRDQLHHFLSSHGIETQFHYNYLLADLPFINNQRLSETFPAAQDAKRQCLSLPIYAELENDEVDFIISMIRQFFEERGGQ